MFEIPFSTKFFPKFSKPLILNSCSTLEVVLVPWDLPKVSEIGAGVEALLYTVLEFDCTKVVQVNLQLPKSLLILFP